MSRSLLCVFSVPYLDEMTHSSGIADKIIMAVATGVVLIIHINATCEGGIFRSAGNLSRHASRSIDPVSRVKYVQKVLQVDESRTGDCICGRNVRTKRTGNWIRTRYSACR